MTDEEARAVKQVRSAARAIVAGTAGLTLGASQLMGSIQMLPQHLRLGHPALDALLAELPLDKMAAEVRLYLSDSDFLANDAFMSKAEARHRVAVLLECRTIYFACSKLLHDAESSLEPQLPNPAFQRTASRPLN